jgi:hypothetical protein
LLPGRDKPHGLEEGEVPERGDAFVRKADPAGFDVPGLREAGETFRSALEACALV